MAETLIERSCQRFRKELSPEDDGSIQASSIHDVRQAIQQVERQLAARQCLRNLDRLNPYIDGIQRYSKAVDVLGNAVPFLPYVWAPLKILITATQDCTQTLDKILTAYGQIGAALPRLSMLGGAFPNNADFQQLLAFLYEDIIEFHSRAYKLIRKPAWKIFFASAWSRFEHRFCVLIDNIKTTSRLIDEYATTIDIVQAKEWRQKSMDDSITRENRWASEQLQAVLNWLDATDNDQELKLEWLKDQCSPGTTNWIVRNPKFRSWMQRGRGNHVMWLVGKPGSGKSVLSSKIISFIWSKPKQHVLFFFCDYHTPAYGISAYIFRAFCTQILRHVPELVTFFYDDYLSKGATPSATVLKGVLSKILGNLGFVRLVVDGIDELPPSEHKGLIGHLTDISASTGDACKLLICSQDLPSIRPSLTRRPILFLGEEKEPIRKDIGTIVSNTLEDLNDNMAGELEGEILESISSMIIDKAEGMFLWVRLVLSFLESSASLWDLKSTIDSLPKDLEDMYAKILNNIRGRCSPTSWERVQRIFEWLLFSKEKTHVRKCELLIGSSFHGTCESLDRNTRPFPTALEVCKPLIEEKPGGTVGFIHSTVAQFLLHSSSGPLTTSLSAHRTIAFSCISHLIHALDFAAGVPSTELTVKVGLGLFGIHTYAAEYWIEHLLQYLMDEGLDCAFPNALTQQASRLAIRHEELSHSSSTAPSSYFPNQSIDARLQNLAHIPMLQALISRILIFRNKLESQKSTDNNHAVAIQQDPTLFSFVDDSYHKTVHSLLRHDDHEGLSAAELHAFRSDYGRTAFLCHIRTCSRSRMGYASAEELQDHKDHQHQGMLKCYQSSCAYNDVGFTSVRGLRDHLKRVHGSEGTRHIPQSIRRKRKATDEGDEKTGLGEEINRGQNHQSRENRQPRSVQETSSITAAVANSNTSQHRYTNSDGTFTAVDQPDLAGQAQARQMLTPSREANPNTSPRETLDVNSDSSHRSSMPEEIQSELNGRDQWFLSHFVQSVLLTIFKCLEINQYESIRRNVIPEVHSNKAYLYCCLRSAAQHYGIITRLNREEVDRDIEKYHNATYRILWSKLNCTDDSEDVLKATLGLTFFPCRIDNFGLANFSLETTPWYRHFDDVISAARKLGLPRIILDHTEQQTSVPFHLLTLTAWIDILGATIQGCAPAFENFYQARLMMSNNSFLGLRELMGCDDRVMYVISDIACLEAGMKDKNNVPLRNINNVKERIRVMQYEILGIVPQTPVKADGTLDTSQLTRNITIAFYYAAQVYLISIMPKFHRNQQDCVDIIVQLTATLQYIPSGPSGFDRILVWVYLIGGVVSTPGSVFRALYDSRVAQVGHIAHLGSFGWLVIFLRQFWLEADHVDGCVHWRDFMNRKNMNYLYI